MPRREDSRSKGMPRQIQCQRCPQVLGARHMRVIGTGEEICPECYAKYRAELGVSGKMQNEKPTKQHEQRLDEEAKQRAKEQADEARHKQEVEQEAQRAQELREKMRKRGDLKK